MKKKKTVKKLSENIVLFPGTVDRLIARANECVEKGNFEEANEYFAEAFQFYEGDELTLSVYSYSLFETRQYEKAKEICEKLISLGPSLYFEVVELYVTICMQLKQFQEAEKLIRSLLEEDKIPKEQIYRFEKLLELNANIAESKEIEENKNVEAIFETFQVDHFLSLSESEQMKEIHMLHSMNIRPILLQLKEIVEHIDCHPFIQSLIVILCVEQQVDIDLTIKKFGHEITVNPVQLTVPTKMPQYLTVLKIIENQLDDNPTLLNMVESVLVKHAIVTYPFEWFDFDSELVAHNYVKYVETLFGKEQEIDNEFLQFLNDLENISQLQTE